MKESSIIKILLESLGNNPQLPLTQFEKLMDVILSLYLYRVENNKDFYDTERAYFINLLSQKFMLHGFAIKKLITGVDLESPSKNVSINILDPFSIYALKRTMIENYLVQNYLSNMLLDDELLNGRFEIWMRYGLLRRGNDFLIQEAKKVIEADKKSIKQLEESIKTKEFYKVLSDNKKVSFLKTIDKEWKIIFKDKNFQPVSWQRLLTEAGIKKEICDQTYNFLSWHAHSQSISVLQLKDMWEKGQDKITLSSLMKELNMYVAFLATDIIHSDNLFMEAYKDLKAEYRDLINFYNLTFRDEKYAIEKIKTGV